MRYIKGIHFYYYYLFPHGFRVGDGGGEKPVPLQAPVEAGPVVVAVAGVWQTPGDEGVELSVCRVAGFARRTAAHAPKVAAAALAISLVMVREDSAKQKR